MSAEDLQLVRELVQRNRYLTLATTGGADPWIAPLEYIADGLNLYFFSPENAVHSQHIGEQATVAVAIFDADQPEYEAAPVIRISGVQMSALARRLSSPYPTLVKKQIEAWGLPMPPYAAYEIAPSRIFLPVLRDGINERVEVVVD